MEILFISLLTVLNIEFVSGFPDWYPSFAPFEMEEDFLLALGYTGFQVTNEGPTAPSTERTPPTTAVLEHFLPNYFFPSELTTDQLSVNSLNTVTTTQSTIQKSQSFMKALIDSYKKNIKSETKNTRESVNSTKTILDLNEKSVGSNYLNRLTLENSNQSSQTASESTGNPKYISTKQINEDQTVGQVIVLPFSPLKDLSSEKPKPTDAPPLPYLSKQSFKASGNQHLSKTSTIIDKFTTTKLMKANTANVSHASGNHVTPALKSPDPTESPLDVNQESIIRNKSQLIDINSNKSYSSRDKKSNKTDVSSISATHVTPTSNIQTVTNGGLKSNTVETITSTTNIITNGSSYFSSKASVKDTEKSTILTNFREDVKIVLKENKLFKEQATEQTTSKYDNNIQGNIDSQIPMMTKEYRPATVEIKPLTKLTNTVTPGYKDSTQKTNTISTDVHEETVARNTKTLLAGKYSLRKRKLNKRKVNKNAFLEVAKLWSPWSHQNSIATTSINKNDGHSFVIPWKQINPVIRKPSYFKPIGIPIKISFVSTENVRVQKKDDDSPETYEYKPLTAISAKGACDGCKMENGAGYNSHPNECEKYIQCFFDKYGLVTAFYRKCPSGQFWNQNILSCQPPEYVNCRNDPCLNSNVGSFTDTSSCRSYWTCQGYSVPRCCSEGHRFVNDVGCVPDDSCQDKCLSDAKDLKTACDKRGVEREPNVFEQYVTGHGWIKMNCASGTRYNALECSCSLAAPKVEATEKCDSLMFLDFSIDERDTSGNDVYVQSEGVKIANGLAYFNGTARLVIPQFTNAELGQNFGFRILFRENGDMYRYRQTQSVINNGDCGDLGSVRLTLDVNNIAFGLETVDEDKTIEFQIPKPKQSDWTEVIYYVADNKLNGWLNGESKSVYAQGAIDKRKCALQIGHGEGFANFIGFIDEVELFRCNKGAWGSNNFRVLSRKTPNPLAISTKYLTNKAQTTTTLSVPRPATTTSSHKGIVLPMPNDNLDFQPLSTTTTTMSNKGIFITMPPENEETLTPMPESKPTYSPKSLTLPPIIARTFPSIIFPVVKETPKPLIPSTTSYATETTTKKEGGEMETMPIIIPETLFPMTPGWTTTPSTTTLLPNHSSLSTQKMDQANSNTLLDIHKGSTVPGSSFDSTTKFITSSSRGYTKQYISMTTGQIQEIYTGTTFPISELSSRISIPTELSSNPMTSSTIKSQEITTYPNKRAEATDDVNTFVTSDGNNAFGETKSTRQNNTDVLSKQAEVFTSSSSMSSTQLDVISSTRTYISSASKELSTPSPTISTTSTPDLSTISNMSSSPSAPAPISLPRIDISTRLPSMNSEQSSISSKQPNIPTTQPNTSSTQIEISSTPPEISSTQPDMFSSQPAITSTPPEISSTPPEISSTQPNRFSSQPARTSTPQEIFSLSSDISTQPAKNSTVLEPSSLLVNTFPTHPVSHSNNIPFMTTSKTTPKSENRTTVTSISEPAITTLGIRSKTESTTTIQIPSMGTTTNKSIKLSSMKTTNQPKKATTERVSTTFPTTESTSLISDGFSTDTSTMSTTSSTISLSTYTSSTDTHTTYEPKYTTGTTKTPSTKPSDLPIKIPTVLPTRKNAPDPAK